MYTKGEYTMPCECEIDRYDNQIIFCPLHNSAPDLLKALQELATGNHIISVQAKRIALEAIAKAELGTK